MERKEILAERKGKKKKAREERVGVEVKV